MVKSMFPRGPIVLFCLTMTLMIVWGVGVYLHWPGRSGSDLVLYVLAFFLIMMLSVLFLRQTILSFRAEVERWAHLQEMHQQMKQTYEGTLQALTRALELRDHATWGHSGRVVGYALAIGEKMGLSEAQLNQLAWGGFLHDIGKIGIPDAILLKTSALTDEELEIIQLHPGLGYVIVSGIEFLEGAADIILLHHERYDGNGYPYGRRGLDIPLLARIFAVADALDAITSDRPYREGSSIEKALEEILAQSGKQFCPECVNALLAVGKDQILTIQERAKHSEYYYDLPREIVWFPEQDKVG